MVPLIKIPDRGIPYQTLLALQTFSPPIFTENLISLKTLRVLREINNSLKSLGENRPRVCFCGSLLSRKVYINLSPR